MELKFMTPTEVWEGYDPYLAHLEASIVSTEKDGDLAHIKQSFTVETTPAGKLRACCDIYFNAEWKDPRGVVLTLPSSHNAEFMQTVKKIIDNNFAVCVLDYCGTMDDDAKTTFPQDLSFAAYPNFEGNLDTIKGSARNTPWFVWAKIVRRALTLLQSIPNVDNDKIALVGIGLGARLAWIVAGIDKRVRALITINGGGYLWALNKPRFTDGNVLSTDEQRAFSSGVGGETYARMVTCPTLFISSRSSKNCDVDRAYDMLELVKAQSKQLIITSSLHNQITNKEFDALLLWLNNNINLQDPESFTPTIRFEIAEGKLYVRLFSIHASNSKKLYVSYGEPQSFNRYWQVFTLQQKVGSHEYICNIPVHDENELVVAYATFEYTSGNIISTKVIGAIPSRLDSKIVEEQSSTRASRIIYDGNMGVGSFTSTTNSTLIDEKNIFMQKGPFGIDGISVKSGNLQLCRSTHEKLSNMATLHLDAYTPSPRKLTVTVYCDSKKYSAVANLSGGEFWQRILLDNSDFKSAEGRTLQNFTSVKMIEFEDTAGIVINNMLWL